MRMMNENVRDYRMAKFGSIIWCEERNVMCFGCLTEDGSCKYKVCLADDPEHQAMRQRQEEKKKAKPIEEPNKETVEASKVTKEKALEKTWKTIREAEAKAEALYRAGETKEANKLMNRSRRLRRKAWEIVNGKEQ